RDDRVRALHAPDAAHLVRHDRLAGAAAAQHDPKVVVAAGHGPRHGSDKIRIVNALGREGPEVAVLDPQLVEEAAQLALEGEAGMVGADGDAHGVASLSARSPPRS